MSNEQKPRKTKMNFEEQISQLKAQISGLTEALQRERADSENIRRRHDEQLGSLRDMVKAHVIKELLPVIDNFERALKHVPKELKDDDYVKGVNAIVEQFEKTLEQMGVKKIQTVGEVFNPTLHEAVSMEEGEGEKEIVAEELQSGYTVDGGVIRHATVRVKPENDK